MSNASLASIVLVVTLASTSLGAQEMDPNWLFAPAGKDDILVQLRDKTGEGRGLCLDFPGFPISGVVSDYRESTWPIGAHTCKTNIPHSNVAIMDQLFCIGAYRASAHLFCASKGLC
jgi:hypothetical protein